MTSRHATGRAPEPTTVDGIAIRARATRYRAHAAQPPRSRRAATLLLGLLLLVVLVGAVWFGLLVPVGAPS